MPCRAVSVLSIILWSAVIGVLRTGTLIAHVDSIVCCSTELISSERGKVGSCRFLPAARCSMLLDSVGDGAGRLV